MHKYKRPNNRALKVLCLNEHQVNGTYPDPFELFVLVELELAYPIVDLPVKLDFLGMRLALSDIAEADSLSSATNSSLTVTI